MDEQEALRLAPQIRRVHREQCMYSGDQYLIDQGYVRVSMWPGFVISITDLGYQVLRLADQREEN